MYAFSDIFLSGICESKAINTVGEVRRDGAISLLLAY